jgi:periplasmic iron binding protein
MRGGPAITGMLRPLVAAANPRYGESLSFAGAGEYWATLHVEPPSDDALSRFVEFADGVARWWKPFDVDFVWAFRPESR